jgi:hypothetical protein
MPFKILHTAILLASVAASAMFNPARTYAQTVPQLSSGIQFGNVIDSASAPALTVFNNRVYVTYVDDNTKTLVVSSAANSNASDLNSGINTGLRARNYTAAITYKGRLLVVYDDQATGSLYQINSADGVNFTSPTRVNIYGFYAIQPQMGIGLGIVSGNNELYISFLAQGNSSAPRQAFSAGGFDGINFSDFGPSITNQGFTANYGASLTTDANGTLAITSTDTDGNLYQNGIYAGNGIRFKFTPYAVNFNGLLYTFGRNWAENHVLELGVRQSGGYPPYYDYTQRISSAPGTTVFNGTLLVAGRSDSSSNLVIFSATQ